MYEYLYYYIHIKQVKVMGSILKQYINLVSYFEQKHLLNA